MRDQFYITRSDFGAYRQSDLGDHVPVQANRHAVFAGLLDGLRKRDFPALDFKPLLGKQLCDLGHGDGPEQLALIAHARSDLERGGLEPVARETRLDRGGARRARIVTAFRVGSSVSAPVKVRRRSSI